MADIDYPYHFDSRGRTATTGYAEHVRDLIEQVLFTAPGERVNRPGFGSGLRQLVFARASDEMATATQFLVQGALQEWLGNRIQVDEVVVSVEDSTLRVRVEYTLRRTQEREVAEFEREGAAP